MTQRSALALLLALVLASVFILCAIPAARAVEPSERLANPVLEARAEAVGRELRCLVCQNESIEESPASFAHDLRLLIRRHIAAGDSNQQVIAYLVHRYGIFILLDPPFEPVTYLLWLGPPLLLLGVGGGLVAQARRRRNVPLPQALSSEESARAAGLLGERQ
ncbi:MAG: cytochrome c-type biogenesis protein [Stellaceae bacterium]